MCGLDAWFWADVDLRRLAAPRCGSRRRGRCARACCPTPRFGALLLLLGRIAGVGYLGAVAAYNAAQCVLVRAAWRRGCYVAPAHTYQIHQERDVQRRKLF